MVAFPGESVNLHVFEPRYKELVKDCMDEDRRFGIPSYAKNTIEYGTEVVIAEIAQVYDDGRMDIRTKAERVFKVLEYQNPMPGKQYAGGDLQYLGSEDNGNDSYMANMIELINQLHELLQIKKRYQPDDRVNTFQIAHNIGLSIEQEYELLKIETEQLRQIFVVDHLQKSIPVIKEMERTREVIKMNGHFKHFDPINF